MTQRRADAVNRTTPDVTTHRGNVPVVQTGEPTSPVTQPPSGAHQIKLSRIGRRGSQSLRTQIGGERSMNLV